jgi:hypothetical protein
MGNEEGMVTCIIMIYGSSKLLRDCVQKPSTFAFFLLHFLFANTPSMHNTQSPVQSTVLQMDVLKLVG